MICHIYKLGIFIIYFLSFQYIYKICDVEFSRHIHAALDRSIALCNRAVFFHLKNTIKRRSPWIEQKKIKISGKS